jgi:uncharacterized membrane protein YhaH (DUF805 family)
VTTFRRLYFSASGRVNRRTYVLYGLAPWVVLTSGLYWLPSAFELSPRTTLILALVALWPLLMVQIKRWHDLDMAGGWTLLSILPLFGQLVIVALAFAPGATALNQHDEDFDPDAANSQSNQYQHAMWAWIAIAAAVISAPLVALTIPWTIQLYERFESGYLGPIFQLGILLIAGFVYLGLVGYVLAVFVTACVLGAQQAAKRNVWPMTTLIAGAVASSFTCVWILRPPVYPVLIVDTLGHFRVTAQLEYPPLSMETVLHPRDDAMTYTGQALYTEENWQLEWKKTPVNVCVQHTREAACKSSLVRTLSESPPTLLLLQDDPLGVRYWLVVDRESHFELRLLGELSRSVADKQCYGYMASSDLTRRGFDELLWAQHDVFIDRRTHVLVPLCAIATDADESLVAISPDRRWAVYIENPIESGLRVRVADIQQRRAFHAYYILTTENPAQLDQLVRVHLFDSAAIFNSFDWDDNGIVALPPFVLTPTSPAESNR